MKNHAKTWLAEMRVEIVEARLLVIAAGQIVHQNL